MSVADPVLFFDGECGLCQRLVRGLLKLDQRGGLRLAPLQGPTAQDWLPRLDGHRPVPGTIGAL